MKIIAQNNSQVSFNVDFNNPKTADPFVLNLLGKLFTDSPDQIGYKQGNYSVTHEGVSYQMILTDERIIRVPRRDPSCGYRYYLCSNNRLGKGGAGSVFSAFKLKRQMDHSIALADRNYAVKVANPLFFGREAEIARFVPGYHAKPLVVFEELAYFFMAKFGNRPVANLEETFIYMETSLKSLQSLHKANFAHWDHSKNNVLFDGKEARVIDFNNSRAVGPIQYMQRDICQWRHNIVEPLLSSQLRISHLPKEVQNQILSGFRDFFKLADLVKLMHDDSLDNLEVSFSQKGSVDEYHCLLDTAIDQLMTLIASWRQILTTFPIQESSDMCVVAETSEPQKTKELSERSVDSEPQIFQVLPGKCEAPEVKKEIQSTQLPISESSELPISESPVLTMNRHQTGSSDLLTKIDQVALTLLVVMGAIVGEIAAGTLFSFTAIPFGVGGLVGAGIIGGLIGVAFLCKGIARLKI